MDIGRQRALVRKSVVAHPKHQGEASAFPSKVTPPPKVVPKQKGAGKDDHPTKKVTGYTAGAN